MPNTTSEKSASQLLLAFLTRLHFYIGLFVGPFIFIAALTGTLYVITPQLERMVYHHELTTDSSGTFHTLQAQIQAARASLPEDFPLKAVRPAIGEGFTTRVMFKDPGLYGWELQTVFVDPVTLEIRGTLASYGTSGILPLRIKLDYLHQNLLLGQTGRYYSELAASWLWIAASGGLVLWWTSRRRYAKANTRNPYIRQRKNHTSAGLMIMLGLFFISATGLTWSKWAGSNIAQWRHSIGWVTPSVSLKLDENTFSEIAPAATPKTPHADHQLTGDSALPAHPGDALFDGVLKTARDAGIDAAKLEIRPASSADKAWKVREIDRAWPTQVDSVAVNPHTMTVTSRADFKDFPLVAKLIRWGIDAHMGVLFGLPNQLILAAFGLTLCAMVFWGYRMWWQRRPQPGSPVQTLSHTWLALTGLQRLLIVVIAALLGLAMPVMGVSLLIFIVFDAIRWWRSQSLQSAHSV
ncbi:PepSY-associated TM helix domain-containing protein [Vibrio quintilis]|nr:PepSY-associated TM helix domain-containing protein [Vibrio quintilis]